jgi:hypothetical protein
MNVNDTQITHHPGAIPSTPLVWPADRHARNQIQQTKGSAKPLTANVLPTTQPNASSVEARTTPQPVQNVRVVTRPAVKGQKTVMVQFRHPPGDPYFTGANIYLRRAGQQPTLIAGGAQSPISFTVPTHPAPHTIFITSVSNWGETHVASSPAHHVRLAG